MFKIQGNMIITTHLKVNYFWAMCLLFGWKSCNTLPTLLKDEQKLCHFKKPLKFCHLGQT